jgi:ABC-type proline/glycine betaine transport system permease subunit
MFSATVATVCAPACTYIRYAKLTVLCLLISKELLDCMQAFGFAQHRVTHHAV